ncbi:MAG: hypothetical protein V4521_12080 [Pseudomonadota bacterium]
MPLRKLLDNPSGGQILSAAVLLALLVVVECFILFGIGRMLLAGSEVRVNDMFLMLNIGLGIGAVVNFLRKRHGSR